MSKQTSVMKMFAFILVVGASVAAVSPALAEGGCGLGWHRGFLGACVRNAAPVVVVAPAPVVVAPGGAVVYAPAGRACPYGYHLGPQGRRCWPN